jgi:diguanylate cyclase (GGDEF)-like protein
MEIKLYFQMLARSWWIVILTGLSAVIAALLAAYMTTPIYRTTASFIVSPNPAYLSDGSNVIYSLDTLDKRTVITTYAEILSSSRIFSETVLLLGVDESVLEEYIYKAVVLPDTNIIEFSVTGTDPKTVAVLTNSVGQQAVEYAESLYQVYDMTMLDPAGIPTEPISPQPIRDAGVALVIGLAIGVALALIRELLRTPIGNFIQQRTLDPVSQALKRSSFEDQLQDIAFASTNDFSLCIVHLDGLTDYIDVLPQPTLEKILRHVTQILKNQLRGNDLVGRWDDVDFTVLLSETPGNAALNTMGRVQTALSVPIKIDISGEDLVLKPKIGIAEYRIGDTSSSLVNNTNWALEMAKKGNGMYLLKANQVI